ncbi:MAG: pyridoxal 5'-phosphate synthase glutaminase subunit PdxT [Spirochaetaceae bacterium]|nr:MAG: pyridoxal 5'-phosphate synthase glutaminase subunit PdxT [Spirochaetaceae bacterium]
MIGVLALQGDFSRHIGVIEALGSSARAVRTPKEIAELDGLIIPGGESTTIGMLMQRFALLDAVRSAVQRGMALFGTCAGAILMATEISGSDQPRLGLIDMSVERNAYGRQIESFEADIGDEQLLPGSESLTAVFIRAPRITRIGTTVRVLARFESDPVLVQQGHLLAATFHPELTENRSIHAHFLKLSGHV